MAFASFFRSSRRSASKLKLEQAAKPVLEGLEVRLLMSTSRHRTTNPSDATVGQLSALG